MTDETPEVQETPEVPEIPLDLEAFLSAIQGDENIADPSTVVTIRSTTGGEYQVPIAEPTSIADVMAIGELTTSQGVEYWVNSTPVAPDFEVAPGAVVTAVGQVKGG